jgi:hypothetical protein
VVDVDHGVGRVDAAPGPAREVGGLAGNAEPVGQRQQQVVAGGGLLGVLGARRLVGHQQLGEGGAVALQLGRGGLDLHAVLAWTYARRREHSPTGVDHAHPAHADRVVPLVVAQHRDLDADLFGRVVDGGALGDGNLSAVDRGGDRAYCGRRFLHGCHLGPPSVRYLDPTLVDCMQSRHPRHRIRPGSHNRD